MSDRSTIEWTDATWNPVTGCTEVSEGCDHCYAKTFAERWRGIPGHHFENGFDVQLRPDKLDQPLRWKKPRRVFVNSMSDLFHEAIPGGYIADVFDVMAKTPQHTYQILTKRHGRMRSLLRQTRPLPNVWLGVSAEDQKWADIRIPALLETPAAVRFVSAEPLLGGMDLQPYLFGPTALDWVIVGGESGRGARPMDLEWVRVLRDMCEESRAAFFYKQQGSWDGGSKSRRELDGRTWDEFPAVIL